MTKEEWMVIHESDLTNNCPECFNQDLKLTFYQKHKFTKLYHKTTAEVIPELLCKTCSSIIYPVKWDKNTENAFNYYQKMVKAQKAATQYTTLFYVIILLLIVLVAAGVYLAMEGMIQF